MNATVTTQRLTTSPKAISSRRKAGFAAARFARIPVSVVAAVAGLAGAAVVFLYGLIAEALSVPMVVDGSAIAPSDFCGGVVTCTIAGGVLAVVLAHWAKRPAQTFLRSTVLLTAISLVFPFIVGDTAISTKLVLALAHLVAAAVVIPPITRRLGLVPRRHTA